MNSTEIKVCGMTSLQQVRELAAMGVDYAGFIFYERSPRYLGSKIAAADLKAFSGLKKVGVFVNESRENILKVVESYCLHAVQLHGDETPKFCESLKHAVTVIKAFRVQGDEDLTTILKPYESAADYFLFDTKAKEYGGTGKKFDWSVLEKTLIAKPYFLSGGIGPDDADAVQSWLSGNKAFALDVNSKFEKEPGVKNMESVKQFVSTIK